MTTLINEIITISKYVDFPIEITSKRTNITYLIAKIDENAIYYKEKHGSSYTNVHDAPLINWNKFFLSQLKKELELKQRNIWDD